MGCGASSDKKKSEKPAENSGTNNTGNSSETAQKSENHTADHSKPEKEEEPVRYERKRRAGVSAEPVKEDDLDDDTPLPVIVKNDEAKNRIRKAIAHNLLFKHLNESQLVQMIDAMFEVRKAAGEKIIRQGDAGDEVDNFYVVEEGVCDILISRDGKEKNVGEIKPGGSFGELALMYQCPRAATVVAKTDVVLWAVDRHTFRRVLLVSILQRRRMFEEFLSTVPLLDAMSSYETSNLCDALQIETYPAHAIIYSEGDKGDRFFMIEEGAVEVTRGGKTISELSRGECFGEVVLLTSKPYDATVKAKVADTKLAWIDRDSFNDLLGPCIDMLKRNMGLYRSLKQSDAYGKALAEEEQSGDKSHPGAATPDAGGAGRKRRQGVSSEALVADDKFVPTVVPKNQDQISRIRHAIASNFLFSSLTEDLLKPVIDAMFEVKKHKGDVVMKQGDEGDNFYILEDGECEFWINEKKVGKNVQAGGSFGELALMYNTPRAATVRVSSPKALLWGVDRQTFRQLVLTSTLKKRRQYEEFLSQCEFLETLVPYEKSTLADALISHDYKTNDIIIKQGDENSDTFYILAEGQAEVTKTGEDGKTEHVKTLKPGDYFGEIALLETRPRAATVTAKTPVTVLSLERDAFFRLLGPIEDILRRNLSKYDEKLEHLKKEDH